MPSQHPFTNVWPDGRPPMNQSWVAEELRKLSAPNRKGLFQGVDLTHYQSMFKPYSYKAGDCLFGADTLQRAQDPYADLSSWHRGINKLIIVLRGEAIVYALARTANGTYAKHFVHRYADPAFVGELELLQEKEELKKHLPTVVQTHASHTVTLEISHENLQLILDGQDGPKLYRNFLRALSDAMRYQADFSVEMRRRSQTQQRLAFLLWHRAKAVFPGKDGLIQFVISEAEVAASIYSDGNYETIQKYIRRTGLTCISVERKELNLGKGLEVRIPRNKLNTVLQVSLPEKGSGKE